MKSILSEQREADEALQLPVVPQKAQGRARQLSGNSGQFDWRAPVNLRPPSPEDASPDGTPRFSVGTGRTSGAQFAVCSHLFSDLGSSRTFDPCPPPRSEEVRHDG